MTRGSDRAIMKDSQVPVFVCNCGEPYLSIRVSVSNVCLSGVRKPGAHGGESHPAGAPRERGVVDFFSGPGLGREKKGQTMFRYFSNSSMAFRNRRETLTTRICALASTTWYTHPKDTLANPRRRAGYIHLEDVITISSREEGPTPICKAAILLSHGTKAGRDVCLE